MRGISVLSILGAWGVGEDFKKLGLQKGRPLLVEETTQALCQSTVTAETIVNQQISGNQIKVTEYIVRSMQSQQTTGWSD